MALLDGNGLQILWAKIKSLLVTKQDTLISGDNIKTINGTSLLGSGNVSISGGSGGGDFDSSGTYPNLTAGKATKLATARTISLSGGARGTATAFDGSKDVSIPVTSLGDLSLTRVYKDDGKANTLSLADLASPLFASNRLAFNNPNSILIYKSNDGGTTWIDYGATDEQKTGLVSGLIQRIYIGGKSTAQVANQDRLRIILTLDRNAYTTIEEFLLYISTAGALSCQCKLSYITISQFNSDADYNAQTYNEITTKEVLGWSGWNRLIQSIDASFGTTYSVNNIKAFLFEFWFEDYRSGYENTIGFYISQLIGIGRNVFENDTGCEMMHNGHLYSYDWRKNATFPAEIRGTKHVTIGGTAEQLVLGNGGLKSIKDITDSLSYYSVDNIISKLTKGGNTTVNDNIVTTNGENRDTYFTIGTSEPIDTSIPYTLGFYIEGLTEGTRWDFNLGGIRIYGVNGYCWATGYFNSTQEGKTSIICDDGTRPNGSLSITISKITLRKGTLRGYGTDAYIKKQGTNQQVVLGDGSLRALSELSPITDADAEILLDNHIHSIDVNANGNDVNISVIESSKNGDTWETEDNDITMPLATTTSAGVMSKEDKAKLDGLSSIGIEPDSGMPDFIGDFEYSDVDYEAIIDLTTIDWVDWVEGGLYLMNAEETWEEDNGDTSYHQCVVTFIYRANGCIPISIVNTNKMTAKMSGMVITINLTEGTGEIRFKRIKLV